MGDFIPSKLSALGVFAANFLTAAGATGTAGSGTMTAAAYLGVTIPGSLSTQIATFTNAAELQLNKATRTKATTPATRSARSALVATLRAFAGQIQRATLCTNAMRGALGLPLRGNLPTQFATPSTAPIVTAAPANSGTLLVRLADTATPTKRSRPHGVRGAHLYIQVGGTAPSNTGGMTFAGNWTVAKRQLSLPSGSGGQKVYLAAHWYTAKGRIGPDSTVTFSTAPY
jgi:hypothetical protein